MSNARITPHTVKAANREKRERQAIARSLRNGDYDTLPSRLPSRAMRTRIVL